MAVDTSVRDWQKHVDKSTGQVYFHSPSKRSSVWANQTDASTLKFLEDAALPRTPPRPERVKSAGKTRRRGTVAGPVQREKKAAAGKARRTTIASTEKKKNRRAAVTKKLEQARALAKRQAARSKSVKARMMELENQTKHQQQLLEQHRKALAAADPGERLKLLEQNHQDAVEKERAAARAAARRHEVDVRRLETKLTRAKEEHELKLRRAGEAHKVALAQSTADIKRDVAKKRFDIAAEQAKATESEAQLRKTRARLEELRESHEAEMEQLRRRLREAEGSAKNGIGNGGEGGTYDGQLQVSVSRGDEDEDGTIGYWFDVKTAYGAWSTQHDFKSVTVFHDHLEALAKTKAKYIAIPPVPPSAWLWQNESASEFVEARRKALHGYFCVLASNKDLWVHFALLSFLADSRHAAYTDIGNSDAARRREKKKIRAQFKRVFTAARLLAPDSLATTTLTAASGGDAGQSPRSDSGGNNWAGGEVQPSRLDFGGDRSLSPVLRKIRSPSDASDADLLDGPPPPPPLTDEGSSVGSYGSDNSRSSTPTLHLTREHLSSSDLGAWLDGDGDDGYINATGGNGAIASNGGTGEARGGSAFDAFGGGGAADAGPALGPRYLHTNAGSGRGLRPI